MLRCFSVRGFQSAGPRSPVLSKGSDRNELYRVTSPRSADPLTALIGHNLGENERQLWPVEVRQAA